MEPSAANDETHEIVIAGGGLCGLATALALHRKGLKSLVLERSDALRLEGGGLCILPNGWRALDQLGVSHHLRNLGFQLDKGWDLGLDNGTQQAMAAFGKGEARCLKRSDLITTIAEALPVGTLRFGCQIVSVQTDPLTKFPRIQLSNGKYIGTKILIGCEGSRSIVADSIGLKPPSSFGLGAIRGLTIYPHGHSASHELVRMTKGKTVVGRIPVNDKLIFWFVVFPAPIQPDVKFPHEPELIWQKAVEKTKDFPAEVQEMMERCSVELLTFTHLKYRSPWEILLGKFHKGTITVAGDAMHVMGPFLAQGGSAGIEDAVVLGRSLAKIKDDLSKSDESEEVASKVGEAFDEYVKERRMRVAGLSTQTYLIGVLWEERSPLVKLGAMIARAVLFSNRGAHVDYDCGRL
nr:FAD-dependent urate hydroxylase-like [Ipomoea batatas]